MAEANNMAAPGKGGLDDPLFLIERGLDLLRDGRDELLLALVGKARARHPGRSDIEGACRFLESWKVPGFHGAMLRDSQRNAAYRKAIEAVVPGRRVLDIGTGSGLLAMMAARAGAHSVVACEGNPRLAETARAVIAANGLADRITVIAKPSQELDRQRDLDGGADCIVSEIFSETLVGEGVIGTLTHAREELAAPGAVFLPERAEIRIALAQAGAKAEAVDDVEGFDLSAFDAHLPRSRAMKRGPNNTVLRSPTETALAFEWTMEAQPARSALASTQLACTGGKVDAVCQWLRIGFGDSNIYENPPDGDPALHWPARLTFIAPRDCGEGDTVDIASFYSGTVLSHWVN